MRKLAAAAALALKSVTSGVEIVQQLRKAVEALRLRRVPVLAYRNAAVIKRRAVSREDIRRGLAVAMLSSSAEMQLSSRS